MCITSVITSHICAQVMSLLKTAYTQLQQQQQPSSAAAATPSRTSGPVRRTGVTKVFEAVRAIALCHNVTPVYDEDENSEAAQAPEADQHSQQAVSYQASSPDEVSFFVILARVQICSSLIVVLAD